MRALLAVALVALLLAPAAAARAPLPYPDPIAALAPKVVEKVAPLEANASQAPWWPDAKPWLERARADAAAGRFHATLYDAETFQEIVSAHTLQDSVNATAATAADRRNLAIQAATAWRADENATWLAFRARLHQADGAIRSLGALETALFAADLAVEGKAVDADFPGYVSQLSREPDLPFDYLLVLARSTKTPQLDIEMAGDALEAAFAQDGVPPQFLADRWANDTRVALSAPKGAPATMQRFEDLAAPAREGGEGILGVAITLAEQRQSRLVGMQTIFGDAATRGKSVVADADRGFLRQLNNTTLEASRAHGLAGVFVADAYDRAAYAQDVVDNGTASLGVVLNAWSGLDHAGYAYTVLADASPVQPPAPAKKSPGPEAALLLGGVALVALALARRRP